MKGWEEDGTWKRIFDSLISKGYSARVAKTDELSIESTTVPPKRGSQVGYNGHKHIKGSKVYAVTTKESFPIAVTMGPANQHRGGSSFWSWTTEGEDDDKVPEKETSVRVSGLHPHQRLGEERLSTSFSPKCPS